MTRCPPDSPSDPGGRRKTFTFEFTLPGPADVVFSLYCPVREREWARDWEAEILYSDSGHAEKDIVFRVNHTVFTYPVYDRVRHVLRMVAVRPDDQVRIWDIRVDDLGPSTSRSTIRCSRTGLTAAGNAAVESWSQEAFSEEMDRWRRDLEKVLLTGNPGGE